MQLVKLNIRGTPFLFDPTWAEDKLDPDSPLLHLTDSSEYYLTERDEFYFNKNAMVFDHVLEYLASGRLHIPGSVCTVIVQGDLQFWGVPTSRVDHCCWKAFYQTDEDVDTIQKLLAYIPSETEKSVTNVISPEIEGHSRVGFLRRRWYIVTEFIRILYDRNTLHGKIWFGILCVTILLSTINVVIATHPKFREPIDDIQPYPFGMESDTVKLFWETRTYSSILFLDGVCNVILAIDWIIRFCRSSNKKTFMKNFLNCIEVVAWLGVWLDIHVELNKASLDIPVAKTGTEISIMAMGGTLLGFIFCIRVFRVFRLIHNNTGVHILLLSLKSSRRELFILATSFSCVVIIFAILLFMADITSTSTSACSNILVAIWWAVVTMTTVGYGDYYPTTPQGCVVGILCAVVGILLIALPIAVISSNFSDFYDFNQYRERCEKNKKKYPHTQKHSPPKG